MTLLLLALAGVPVMLTAQTPVDPMRGVAARYVQLVLAVGQHDAD